MDTPVGIDRVGLARWMRMALPQCEEPVQITLVAGGHSCLTYLLTDAAGVTVVLRRPPVGALLASAHDVLREHRIISALAPTPVPVAPTPAFCEDPEVIGAPFYLMDFVEGVILHDQAAAAASLPDPTARQRAGRALIEALVALHQVDPAGVGLDDLSPPGDHLDRQLRRWSRQWEAARTRDLPDMERLHAWLVDHRPAPSPRVIVHGDFRLGNMILSPDGDLRAILDWELCSLGEPMADLSYLLRSWVQPGEATGPHLIPPTVAGGFCERAELAAWYQELSSRSCADLDYWMAFNAWRSAAISEGVLRRYIDGAMGQRPDDLTPFARGVEASVAAGLEWASRAG